MRTFLWVLMVVIVSGDDTAIRGFLEDSVLLPCNCSESDTDFKWQMEKPTMMLVFQNNETLSNRYKGRTEGFWSKNSNNCSVLLTNITAEDQGEYRCIFHSHDTYHRLNVNLTVSVNYNVCQPEESLSGGVTVFQCDVSGRYRESWIQWTLDGQPLINSTTTNITHTNTDALTGLYHFYSTLSTKLNSSSKPTCDVKAKNMSTTLNPYCEGRTDPIKDPSKDPRPQPVVWTRCILKFPIVLFGLFLLVLSLRGKREVPTSKHTTKPDVTM